MCVIGETKGMNDSMKEVICCDQTEGQLIHPHYVMQYFSLSNTRVGLWVLYYCVEESIARQFGNNKLGYGTVPYSLNWKTTTTFQFREQVTYIT